jgi:hypothetical protein
MGFALMNYPPAADSRPRPIFVACGKRRCASPVLGSKKKLARRKRVSVPIGRIDTPLPPPQPAVTSDVKADRAGLFAISG